MSEEKSVAMSDETSIIGEKGEVENFGGVEEPKFSISALFQNKVFIYLIRRFFVLIPLWLGISIITFAGTRALGDPSDQVVGSGLGR